MCDGSNPTKIEGFKCELFSLQVVKQNQSTEIIYIYNRNLLLFQTSSIVLFLTHILIPIHTFFKDDNNFMSQGKYHMQ